MARRRRRLIRVDRPFRLGLAATLGVGTAVLLLNSLESLTTLITWIVLALFLALGADPVVSWLERRGVRRVLAVAIVAAALILLATGAGLLIVPTLVSQFQAFVVGLPHVVDEISRSDLVIWLGERLATVADVAQLVDSLGEALADPANLVTIGGGVLSVGASIAGVVGGAIIVLILTVYFVAGLPSIKRGFISLAPATAREEIDSVTDEVTRSVGRFVLGQASLAAINGACSAILLTAMGAPFPALLAFVAFLGSMVPLVGSVIASTVIVASCLAMDLQLALIVGIYYLVYMQVEAYILSPRIMKRAVQIPPPVVIIAAISGGTLGGVLGALMAIPIAAAILIVIRRSIIPRQDER